MRGTNPAMNDPDRGAWCLFLYVMSDAKGAGNNNALFETWPSDADTFQWEPHWKSGTTTGPKAPLHQPVLAPVHNAAGSVAAASGGGQFSVMALPFVSTQCSKKDPGETCVGEEVRRNPAAYDFIVRNKLYTRDDLGKFKGPISFSEDAIEIKANWVPVYQLGVFLAKSGAKPDPSSYHINTVMENGKPVQYALVSFHVISKMIPNWTWATFEHKDNPGRCDIIGCVDKYGASTPILAPAPATATQAQVYAACIKTPALEALFKSVHIDPAFENYCLKGNQIDFTDATGVNTRLGNSVTESGFVETSSCMGCHSRAAYAFSEDKWYEMGVMRGDYTPIAPMGAPDPGLYWRNPDLAAVPGAIDEKNENKHRLFKQADFVWSIPFCAVYKPTPGDKKRDGSPDDGFPCSTK